MDGIMLQVLPNKFKFQLNEDNDNNCLLHDNGCA